MTVLESMSGVVADSGRHLLYVGAGSNYIRIVRWVNLGVGFLTPGLTVDLGNMWDIGQTWFCSNLEGEDYDTSTLNYRGDEGERYDVHSE